MKEQEKTNGRGDRKKEQKKSRKGREYIDKQPQNIFLGVKYSFF